MIASDKCIELIKSFEGFRAEPYLCPASIPTIGYGSTRYSDGSAVNLHDPAISEHDADELLRYDVAVRSSAVSKLITIASTQDEFDALVDFAYNIGVSALASSTLLKRFNAGDRIGAANEFGKWVHANGKVLPGLVRRRDAEYDLFMSND